MTPPGKLQVMTDQPHHFLDLRAAILSAPNQPTISELPASLSIICDTPEVLAGYAAMGVSLGSMAQSICRAAHQPLDPWQALTIVFKLAVNHLAMSDQDDDWAANLHQLLDLWAKDHGITAAAEVTALAILNGERPAPDWLDLPRGEENPPDTG